MVHHLCLIETKPNLAPEQLENLMVEIRIRLLKIPEVSNLRVGKRIDSGSDIYDFFFSFDVENMDKLRIIHDNAIYTKFQKQILENHTVRLQAMNFEMEPGKDTRYS